MRVLHYVPLLALAAALGATPSARAREALAADRPDFIDSSTVVRHGHWQVESALAGERDAGAGILAHPLATPTLLRVGIGESVELRAEGAALLHAKTADADAVPAQRITGFSYLAFGATWRVRHGNAGWLPGVAWLADVQTSAGGRTLRGMGVRPSVRATAEWELSDNCSLGVMPGLFLDRNPLGKRYAAGILAVTLGKAWTPRWRTFVEVAAERLALSRNGGSSVTFDTGLAFAATKSLQFDIAVSHGLSPGAPDVRGGLGLSARF